MKRFLKVCFFLLPIIAIGQNKTYLGLEFGPKFDVYQAIDNGDGLYTKPFLYSPIYGVSLEQELNKTFSVETGFFVNDYGESFRVEGDFGYGTSNAIQAFQIPIRVKAKLALIPDRLHLIGTAGYTFAINNDYESSGAGGSFTTSVNPDFNDSTRIDYVSDYQLAQTYGLIEAGAALDFTLNNGLRLFLAGNYMTGLTRVVEIDVTYRINDNPSQSATVYSNGGYFSFVFGLKYPISSLWKK